MEPNWEEFYANHPKPSDLESSKKLLTEFVKRYSDKETRIALVTVSNSFGLFASERKQIVRFWVFLILLGNDGKCLKRKKNVRCAQVREILRKMNNQRNKQHLKIYNFMR